MRGVPNGEVPRSEVRRGGNKEGRTDGLVWGREFQEKEKERGREGKSVNCSSGLDFGETYEPCEWHCLVDIFPTCCNQKNDFQLLGTKE